MTEVLLLSCYAGKFKIFFLPGDIGVYEYMDQSVVL